MKTVFLIDRANNFRYFSSLIEEGLARNHDIECWHDYSFRKDSSKGYLFPEIERSPFHGKKNPDFTSLAFDSHEELKQGIVSRKDVSFFVSLHPPELILDRKSLDRFTGGWCIIMHGPDSFKEIKNLSSREKLPSVRRYFFPYTEHMFNTSMHFFDRFIEHGNIYFSEENTTVHAIGCSMFGPALKNIDKDTVRHKFRIPAEKDILLYLPYTFNDQKKHKESFAWQAAFAGLHIERRISKEFDNNSFNRAPLGRRLSRKLSYLRKIVSEPEARTWLLKGWNEPAVIKAARAFCDNNDLHLVVKPRRKFDFSEEVYRKADIIIDDDESQQYPSKLQELFSVAKLCMGYFSTAVIESVFCNVPAINLHCPDALFYDPHQHFWCPVDEGSLFALKGAVWNMQIPNFIRDFPSMDLSSLAISTDARNEYMRKFTGKAKPSAAENFFDVLEANRQQKNS